MRRSVRLPAPVRDRLEHTFGTRLGNVAVRLADGPTAGVARGETVTLAERHYRPDTAAGLWLLAHEFAHVVPGWRCWPAGRSPAGTPPTPAGRTSRAWPATTTPVTW